MTFSFFHPEMQILGHSVPVFVRISYIFFRLQKTVMRFSLDDTVTQEKSPIINTDYLSHLWLDEDIWSTGQYLSHNRNVIENADRLENALWRTWGKTRCALGTIQPEQIDL